jgi:CRISPR-associated endonuclease/helicase Cas3
MDMPTWMRLAVLISILRHHGNLDEDGWGVYYKLIKQDMRGVDGPLRSQLNSIDWAGMHQWLLKQKGPSGLLDRQAALPVPDAEIITGSVLAAKHPIRHKELKNAFSTLGQSLQFLAAHGALLAADKFDAAGLQTIIRQELPAHAVRVYVQRNMQDSKGQIALLRKEISSEVAKTWLNNLNTKLFTLTAPTGSGKTLSIFNAALQVRSALGNRVPYRIIYCLPFTSVIDQNHQVLKNVLNMCCEPDREDILLKHHHLVEGVYRTRNITYEPGQAGELLTETWQSEVVVTTFYQLLHTVLSNRNSQQKRASQLINSIVLLDEVQAVPLKYWQTLRILFKEAAEVLNVRFVMLTATRPLIFHPDEPDVTELLPDHSRYFRSLSRVRLVCHPQPIGLDEWCDTLRDRLNKKFISTLIVLNRRKAVKHVFERLRVDFPNTRVIALSTDLTPRDRRVRIRLINMLLKKEKPCIVVSTQLIEAGVDVSFPEVHRDMAPLDCIIQTCGRSNRHSTSGHGRVHLWNMYDDGQASKPGKALWHRIYDPALIDVTRDVLGLDSGTEDEFEIQEQDFLLLSQQYFSGCMQRSEHVDLIPDMIAGNWNTIDAEFELIPGGLPTATCFVIQNNIDQALWDRYQEIVDDPSLDRLQKKAEFALIKRKFYERVVQVYAPPDPSRPVVTPIYASMGHYSRETGFACMPEMEASTIF